MAERKERCSHCRRLLLVPPEAHTIKCAVCHGITQIGQASNTPSLVYNSLSHAANRLRGFINTMITGSFNSNVGYGTPHYGYYPPQPQLLRPQAPLVPASAYGSKRALLCGICYHRRSYRLKGSMNDVKFMRYFLINQFGFPGDSILMLTDDKEEKNPLKIPTKKNIQTAMRWLVEGCRPGDSLVFHFSGHGTQEVDNNMDEIDGYDEALLPVDYEINGMILDDEINARIVRPLPHGAKLHAIIDACHSGTILDLPFVCKMSREGFHTWEDQTQPRADYKGTRGGLAICISACEDAGSSVDTSAFGGSKVVTGALTYSLIQAVENEPGLSYGRLLSAIRAAIKGAKVGIVALNGPIISLLNKMLGMDRIRQDAQLSSSEKFDIHAQRFVL
ncbi:metacaspase-3-like isoform X1 [Prosopis cineraria]|uniref:metacaspase-3-like isoform X1 n=1 Tax=Prosopis cineraria TaxID=364024 RepID=UPI00240F78C1|nr:metacaspase-3-like isoform X1 [Prosopis cineraria]